MKARSRFVWIIAMLLMLSLACAQAGEVLTPAEATERARGGSLAGDDEPGVEGAEFARDQQVEFTGTGFLISLYAQPGDTVARSHISRGSKGTVLASREFEGETWYQVSTSAGNGWVPAEFVKAVEDGSTASTGTEGGETAEPEDGGEGADGPRPGDTAYLAGRAFLVGLMEAPGSKRMIAGQERGARVTVVDVTEVDGVLWYLVDAPTGKGWVSAENISTEAP